MRTCSDTKEAPGNSGIFETARVQGPWGDGEEANALMDFQYITQFIPQLAVKLPVTIAMVAVCYVLGFLLAFIIFLGRISHHAALRAVLETYVSFVRCVPIVLLLFLVYYGMPQLIVQTTGIDIGSWSKFVFAGITLVLFNGGWISEIFRSAYDALPKEQSQLALSLGYSRFQNWTRVIIPQMIGTAIPDLGSAAIDLLKDSSLLFTIGIVDTMGLASILVSNNFGIHQADIYLAVALVYWVATLLIEACVWLVKRASRYYRLIAFQNEGIVA